jgi:hypothetical protein
MNRRYLALAALYDTFRYNLQNSCFSLDAKDAWPLTLFLLQAFKNIMS